MTLASDVRKALLITWVLVSVLLMSAAVAPWIFPPDKLLGLFPPCPSRLAGSRCVLCGMTTAWISIASGDIDSALRSNGLSLGLWTATVMNFVVMKFVLLLMMIRRRPAESLYSCN